jgi:hypothetical protein
MSSYLRIVSVSLVLFVAGQAGFAGEAPAPPPAKPAPAKASRPKMPAAPKLTDAEVVKMAKASRLSSDSVRLAVDFVYRYKPRMARDFMTLYKKEPQKFRYAMSECGSLARSLESLRRSDPTRYKRQRQMYALQAQSDLLVDHYQEVGEAEKPHVEVQLTEALANLFDLRLEEDRYQLELMRKQVDQTQARIDQKASNKDRIVDRELTRMLGLDAILAW